MSGARSVVVSAAHNSRYYLCGALFPPRSRPSHRLHLSHRTIPPPTAEKVAQRASFKTFARTTVAYCRSSVVYSSDKAEGLRRFISYIYNIRFVPSNARTNEVRVGEVPHIVGKRRTRPTNVTASRGAALLTCGASPQSIPPPPIEAARRNDICSYYTQRWLVQTSLPHRQTSLQLSGLVCGYKVCSDHIMQTGLSQ